MARFGGPLHCSNGGLHMGSLVSIANIMQAQPSLFQSVRAIFLTPEVESLLAADCTVAVGVSGGKDSVACPSRGPSSGRHGAPRTSPADPFGSRRAYRVGGQYSELRTNRRTSWLGTGCGPSRGRRHDRTLAEAMGEQRGPLSEPGVCEADIAMEYPGNALLHK
jgi:hypothetical protein